MGVEVLICEMQILRKVCGVILSVRAIVAKLLLRENNRRISLSRLESGEIGAGLPATS